jgi:hypothetical protein
MIAVRCAHCGARNRIRGRSHAKHPFCGKCNTPLPAKTQWIRIPADLRTGIFNHAPAVGLAILGLLLGVGATGWLLYPSTDARHGLTGPPDGKAAVAPVPAPVAPPAAAPSPGTIAAAPATLPAAVPVRHGVQQIYLKRERLAPLAIETPGGREHYYLKLEDALTGRLAMTIFVEGGHNFRTRVPFGSYRILYATGTTWYGPQLLFGPKTRRFRLDRTFEFARKRGAYVGARIELGQRASGSPGSIPVPTVEFRPADDASRVPPSTVL